MLYLFIKVGVPAMGASSKPQNHIWEIQWYLGTNLGKNAVSSEL